MNITYHDDRIQPRNLVDIDKQRRKEILCSDGIGALKKITQTEVGEALLS